MPTAAKLIAAIFLAVTGYFTGELVKPLIEEGRDVSKLSPTIAALGLAIGWKFLGPRMDKGLGSVGANGFTAAVLLGGLSFFAVAFGEMIKRSLRMRYDGPIEALQDIFMIMSKYAVTYVNAEIIIAVLLGCLVTTWCARGAALKWG